MLPEHLDDYVTENNPVRIVDVFVEELDLASLGFGRVHPAKTGRPAYHSAVLLKLYIYGYLNIFNRADGLSARPSATSTSGSARRCVPDQESGPLTGGSGIVALYAQKSGR